MVYRIDQVLNALNHAEQPDIIIIACNSASTVALPFIREKLNIPVIGVVPAIKPAAVITGSNNIALLATPATISRSYTNNLIEKFAANFNWLKLGSSELVEIAENKMHGHPVDKNVLKNILMPLSDASDIDTVVLACTHFPLILEELSVTFPHIENWVDSSDAIAERTGFWLDNIIIKETTIKKIIKNKNRQRKILFTHKNSQNNALKATLEKEGFNELHSLDIS